VIRTNLATRPFYNERGVRSGLVALALVSVGLTAFNAIEILQLEGQSRQSRQSMAQNAQQAREMRDKARVIRQSINQAQLDAVQVSAREANSLIDRRTFSWTELLNFFQATLPPDVRIVGVSPQIDQDGRLLVAMSVLSRRIDDLNEFLDALEDTQAFSAVLSRQDSVDEDGIWHSAVQAYYGAVTSADRPVPASESGTPAPGNATPSNATGPAPAAPAVAGGAAR
jgi:hypothetical protein